MSWNDWPYWLKGGILFAVFAFVILALFFSYAWFQSYSRHYPPIYGPSLLPGGGSSCYVYNWISGEPNEVLRYGYNGDSWKGECISVLIFDIFLLFVLTFIAFGIGTIFGWIYGKFKEK